MSSRGATAGVRGLAAALLALTLAACATSEVTGDLAPIGYHGTPAQLGQELIHRAETGAYPMFGYDLTELREGAARLHSLDPDEWADIWSNIGERRFAAGEAAEAGGDRERAQREFDAAFNWFSLARWPAPHTERRRAAYQRSLEAFHRYDRLNDPPLQEIAIQFQGTTAIGYLRVPRGEGPFPLFVQIGGLDGYKELLARGQSVSMVQSGIATLTLDAPGTGEGVRITPDAWQSLRLFIETATSRSDIDENRVVLWGGSFGGYWAAALAYRMPDAFRGVVVHGVTMGIAEIEFGEEYLFDGPVAITEAVQGARNYAEARRLTRNMGLETSGLINGRTPPMLMLNGAHDTLTPIEGLYTLLGTGETAKEAWVNPRGVHLGRQFGVWTFGQINDQITMPWVYRHLGVEQSARPHGSDIP